MSIFGDFFKKEAPLLGLQGSGGGLGFLAGRGGGAFQATGGNQTPTEGLQPGNGYVYHYFTSPGTFEVSSDLTAEFMIVGGGGAGGMGGGGAGGIVYHPGLGVPAGTYNVTVGDGGTYSNRPESFGKDSLIAFPTTYGASGGGAGAQMNESLTNSGGVGHGQPGGSGGGASRHYPNGGSQPGGGVSNPYTNPGATEYGNSGGSSSTEENGQDHRAGGGGGASTGGNPGLNSVSPGGSGRAFPAFAAPLLPGLPSPWQSAVGPNGVYGGGGGGGKGKPASTDTPSAGGNGGGGSGGVGSPGYPPGVLATPGVDYTGGGGGGGGSGPGQGTAGGNGGKGIVIIRYLA